MQLQQYWDVLKGRANYVVGSLFVIVGLTAVVLYFEPETYTASTSLNFDFKGANPYSNLGGTTSSQEGSYIATQVEILESINVAKRVVELLSEEEKEQLSAALDERITLPQIWLSTVTGALASLSEEQPEAASGDEADSPMNRRSDRSLARSLPADLVVKPVVGSRILTVAYTSTDPHIAALISNTYAQAYIDTNLNMIVDPARQTKTWFDDRLAALRSRVEEAQAALAAYQEQQGIVATDERYDVENQRLMDLNTQLSEAQQKKREAMASLERLNEMRGNGSLLDAFPDILADPVVQNLRSQVRALEVKLAELSGRMGENHPTYQRATAELNAARSELRSQIQSVVESIENNVQIAGQQEAAARAAVAQQKELVLGLKKQRGRVDVLNGDLESAQQAYNTALEQFNQTNLQSLVTQTNVSVIDPASRPRDPSGPKVAQNLVLAIAVGLMLGIGLAVGMELIDRRVRSAGDFSGELGVPLLGVLKGA